MKKIIVILMLFTFVSSLFAVADNELQVVAYKKQKSTKQTNSLTIIDALTGTLATIPNETLVHATQHNDSKHLNMTDYINNYLDDGSKTTYTDLELSKKAIFSVHVNGNATGTYTVKITFGNFANITDPSKVIKNVYYFRKYNAFFTSTGSRTSSIENNNGTTIYCDIDSSVESPDTTGLSVPDTDSTKNTEKSFEFAWKVGKKTSTSDPYNYASSSTETDVVDYWEVEAMIALVVDKATYTAKDSSGNDVIPNGEYEAEITVSLTVG